MPLGQQLVLPLDMRALQVQVVPLHVVTRLLALVRHRVLELQRDDIRLTRLAPKEDARESKRLGAAVEDANHESVEGVGDGTEECPLWYGQGEG